MPFEPKVEDILKTLNTHTRDQEKDAVKKLKDTFKNPRLTAEDVKKYLRKNDIRSWGTLFRSEKDLSDFESLVKLAKNGPVSFRDVCDKLSLPPGKAQKFIEDAIAKGIQIKIAHNHIDLNVDTHRRTSTVDPLPSNEISPVVGVRQKVGVISDTHYGSKYCLRKQIQDFVHYAYSQGVREILHPGDVIDGCYRHGMYEVSHAGLDDQIGDLYENLPSLPGLSYHCITGNHDFTFFEKVGVDIGEHIEGYFRKRGRKDIFFYGDRGAFLKIRGAVIHLWHPRSGVPYARSYHLQKQVERYTSLKPQILLTGHWHDYCHPYERNVHAIACPTFQGGGSAFGKSLGGSPAIGGLILSWDVTEKGALRSFSIEKRSYFEQERPISVQNDIDAIPV